MVTRGLRRMRRAVRAQVLKDGRRASRLTACEKCISFFALCSDATYLDELPPYISLAYIYMVLKLSKSQLHHVQFGLLGPPAHSWNAINPFSGK